MGKDNDRVEVFRDTAGEWRWRVVAGNGRIIASSGESFTRKWSARRAGRRAQGDQIEVKSDGRGDGDRPGPGPPEPPGPGTPPEVPPQPMAN